MRPRGRHEAPAHPRTGDPPHPARLEEREAAVSDRCRESRSQSVRRSRQRDAGSIEPATSRLPSGQHPIHGATSDHVEPVAKLPLPARHGYVRPDAAPIGSKTVSSIETIGSADKLRRAIPRTHS